MKKLTTDIRVPMSQDGLIDEQFQTIILQNTGTSTVRLGTGQLYSILPGSSLTISAVENSDFVELNAVKVFFDTTAGAVNRLEIIILNVKDC